MLEVSTRSDECVDDLHAKPQHPSILAGHQRLQSAVVEAAKTLRRAEKVASVPNDFDVVEAQRAQRIAVDVLIAFEAEHF